MTAPSRKPQEFRKRLHFQSPTWISSEGCVPYLSDKTLEAAFNGQAGRAGPAPRRQWPPALGLADPGRPESADDHRRNGCGRTPTVAAADKRLRPIRYRVFQHECCRYPKTRTVPQPDTVPADPPLVEVTKQPPTPAAAAELRQPAPAAAVPTAGGPVRPGRSRWTHKRDSGKLSKPPSDRTGHRIGTAEIQACRHAPGCPSRACVAARLRLRSAARSIQRRHRVADSPRTVTARGRLPQARHNPSASRRRPNSSALVRSESRHALHLCRFHPVGRLAVQVRHRASPPNCCGCLAFSSRRRARHLTQIVRPPAAGRFRHAWQTPPARAVSRYSRRRALLRNRMQCRQMRRLSKSRSGRRRQQSRQIFDGVGGGGGRWTNSSRPFQTDS